jgi:hypothetical protein
MFLGIPLLNDMYCFCWSNSKKRPGQKYSKAKKYQIGSQHQEKNKEYLGKGSGGIKKSVGHPAEIHIFTW